MTIAHRYIPRSLALIADRDAKIAAHSKPDPLLSEEGNRQATESWTKKFQADYVDQRDAMIRQAEAEASAAQAAADRHQAFSLEDVATLTRSEQAWTHIIKPELEAGTRLDDLVADADLDTVVAVERFARPWLKLNNRNFYNVDKAVADRLADLAPDQKTRNEIRGGAVAAAELQALHTVVTAIEAGRDGEAARVAQDVLGRSARFVYGDRGQLMAIEAPAA